MIKLRRRWSGWMACACLVWCSLSAGAQDGWFKRHRALLAETLTQQPHWATPLITISPRLEEDFRADFTRQSLAGSQSSWNYGTTKGLQIVPLSRLELRVSPPPFLTHSDRSLEDGFGDVAFRGKVRLYGSNEEHHNAMLTALLGATVPTGKNGNGSCCAILTPALEGGKGLGKVDLITFLGGSLPVSNTLKLGRQIVWNNVVQVHVAKYLWAEAETNSTFYFGGRNDGKQQTFLTPGILATRIPLNRGTGTAHPTVTLGFGEQIALTHFYTYNHSPIYSVRFRF